jgi:cbb3-type cytochrome oxidase subunit 3
MFLQLLKLLFVIFILILFYEAILTLLRHQRRKNIYKLAKQSSIDLKKPLLVIGDPDNGTTNFLLGKSYDYGDLCVDLVGCKGAKNSVTSKVEDFLPNLPDNSYVIFISCVLEYVDSDKLDFIISEIKRVSGNNFFLVNVDPLTITAYFYPTRFITREKGPNQIILSQYPQKEIFYKKLKH